MEKTVLKFHGRGDHLKLVRVTDEKTNHTIYKVEYNRKIVWAGEWLKTAMIKFRAKAWELMSQEELPGITETAQEPIRINISESEPDEICNSVGGWMAKYNGEWRRISENEKRELCKKLHKDNENYYYKKIR